MNISLDFPIEEKERLSSLLKQRGFSFRNIDYSFFRAEKDGISITLYQSGKLLIQGKEIDEIYRFIKDTFFTRKTEPWMGTDEAGKGDYFGPLVVAGVIMEPEKEYVLQKLGVKDSKRLSPAKIEELAGLIRNTLPYEVIILPPKVYNDIYNEKKNLNLILSEMHIQVIRNLLKRKGVKRVVVDKFSSTSGISEYFKDEIKVDEIVKGERDLACAAASILARASFEEKMREMSKKYGFFFPKGAGKEVREALLKFLERFPSRELKNVAKLHFRLTNGERNG